MSLRQAVASLLKRSFSPRATPRTTPARPLHSSSVSLVPSVLLPKDPQLQAPFLVFLIWIRLQRGLTTGDGLRGAAGVAAAALAGGGALVYYKKGPHDDEPAAREKEEDMKARFEDWAKKYDRTYQDEEEKAMRFQVFKDNIKWIESQPASARNACSRGTVSRTLKTRSSRVATPVSSIYIGPRSEEYRQRKLLEENGKASSSSSFAVTYI
ncbi:hypothetical protein ACQ4PT_031494 [Festuca glaucescens]